MKRQGSGNERQGTGIRDQGTERLQALLRSAIPRVEQNAESPHDLWPAMRQRLNRQPNLVAGLRRVPWFDWALAGLLVAFALAFPAAVPMLLYYL